MVPDAPAVIRKPLRRILFVSRHYSSDFAARVAGIYQRMRMLLDAAQASADRLDILFFVDPDIAADVGPLPAQRSLLDGWGIEACVTLAPRARKENRGRIVKTLQPLFDFRTNDDFQPFSGTEQIAAVTSMLTPGPDLVLVLSIHPATAVTQAIRASGRAMPIVLDVNDIEHRTQARIWRRPPWSAGRLFRFLEYPALVRGEIETIAACRQAFVCSPADAVLLEKKGLTNVAVIANSVKFAATEPAGATPAQPTLFFIGTYSYPPNREAVAWLVDRVFPLVRQEIPEVRLTIAGESCERLPPRIAEQAGVDVVGFVEDLDAAYRSASVVCCSVLTGGGTRVKIIEAATRKRPVVSTTIGAEGLAFEDGSEILLRDTPAAFAQACVGLLKDPGNAAGLAERAYAKARSEYDRQRIVARITAALVDR